MAVADTTEFFEFRGVEDLFYAKVLTDNEDGYTTDTPKRLAFIKSVGKTTSVSSETTYYDNKAMSTTTSYGAPEITLTCSVLDLKTEADINGDTFDEETGMLIEGDKTQNQYAIMYKPKLKGDKGTKERYVVFYKGTFAIGDVTHNTEDDGTETTNQEITYTALKTQHKFEKGGSVTRAEFDEGYDKLDFSTFYDAVVTPDTVDTLKKVTA